MQETNNKGYILPMVLIVILLGLAGFFMFAVPTKAPVATEDVPQATNVPVMIDSTDTDDTATSTDEDESSATSTATTTEDVVDVSAELE